MKNRTILLSALLIFVFLLAACGGKASGDAMGTPTEDAMMDKATEPAMMTEPARTGDAMMTEPAMTEPAMTEDAMMTEPAMTGEPTGDAMMKAPAWFGTSFKDVRSGNSFTIDDFKGKVVLVETMAVWCTTCYQQQTQIKALHETLGMREDFVSISLDIDPNEDEQTLTAYTQKNSSFDWQYAVAGPEVAREIGKTYGDQFLNPPSAPVLVIDRHGVAHPLPFGVKSAEDLMKAIQPYLDAKM
jgi:cytochrome oxidase Cu insertion factor (SCO1/SenC/PrrC family)